MNWLVDNWDAIMTVINSFGLLLVSFSKRKGGSK